MSNSYDHDRRALGIAAATLRSLADEHLYSDAFRHRIMGGSSPNSVQAMAQGPARRRNIVGGTAQLLLYHTAKRLDNLAERLAPPDTPAARLARLRKRRSKSP